MSKREPYKLSPAPAGVRKHWKSLESFEASVQDQQKSADTEFPLGTGDIEGLSRRGFLTIAGATTALLGLEGCIRRPVENILPYSQAPEYLNPGVPMHFATVTQRRGESVGLLVNSYEGRPTKIEGNPDHPASGGATDLLIQASILDLYDPDRAHTPALRNGTSWTTKRFSDVDALISGVAHTHGADRGAGLRFLAQPSNSLSFVRMRQAILARFPEAKFHTWTPVNESASREGARLAFGQPLVPTYDYDQAKVILSVDSDFLQTESGSVASSRSFAHGRSRLRTGMNRLYVVESTFSTTGANADHRVAVAPSMVEPFLRALAGALVQQHVDFGPIGAVIGAAPTEGLDAAFITALARDLVANRAHSAIVVGSRQPAIVHALGYVINGVLGNFSGVHPTVTFNAPADDAEIDQTTDIAALVTQLNTGNVKTLFILGGNPVYDAPADLNFAAALEKVETSIHLSAFRDETSAHCTWQVPRAHELETWGDQRSVNGTLAVQQPLIAPLFGGRSDIEVLAHVAGEANWRGYYVVRQTIRENLPSLVSFEQDWRRILHRGIAVPAQPFTAAPPFRTQEIATALATSPARQAASRSALELVFAADAKMLDGRHINNAWLLELPDPMTRITWDNAAIMSPQTARELGVSNGDMIRVSRGGASVEIVAWMLPGHPNNTLTMPLGWGRTAAGRYGNGHGFNVYPLRRSDALHFATGATVAKMGATYPISQTQDHNDMAGRPIALEGTLAEYEADPEFAVKATPTPRALPLWREVQYRGHKWGMTIDLNACTGCNTCVIACQAENNIPTVGKEMVARGREMHWIRIDRYFVGDNVNQPEGVSFQPLACQHCEEAPCENVCPVNATAHSPEGLNDMAYNRCIGTRYCANNCPYKVRRFNYLNWQINHEDSGEVPTTKAMQFNPNVTVRTRGVMEKCSYCVQRIEMARIARRITGSGLQDGDITSACAQACPAEAIVFGDLNDANSRVSQKANQDRHYKLLAEIGTQPRTTYLARITNPNPELTPAAARTAEPAAEHTETHR